MAAQLQKKTGAAPWKKSIGELEGLRGQAGQMAHRRTTLLCELASDADFIQERCFGDATAVESILDELVEDLALRFFELRLMLNEYPAEDSWSDGKLRTLYDAAVEQYNARQKKRSDDSEPIKKPRATLAQLHKLEEEKSDLTFRIKSLEAQNAQLIQDNERLRMDNAELRGRITELEKANRRPAA